MPTLHHFAKRPWQGTFLVVVTVLFAVATGILALGLFLAQHFVPQLLAQMQTALPQLSTEHVQQFFSPAELAELQQVGLDLSPEKLPELRAALAQMLDPAASGMLRGIVTGLGGLMLVLTIFGGWLARALWHGRRWAAVMSLISALPGLLFSVFDPTFVLLLWHGALAGVAWQTVQHPFYGGKSGE